jgi:hypothetical protein
LNESNTEMKTMFIQNTTTLKLTFVVLVILL